MFGDPFFLKAQNIIERRMRRQNVEGRVKSPKKMKTKNKSTGDSDDVSDVIRDAGCIILHRIRELEATDERLKEECEALSRMLDSYTSRMRCVKNDLSEAYGVALNVFGVKFPSTSEGSFAEAFANFSKKHTKDKGKSEIHSIVDG